MKEARNRNLSTTEPRGWPRKATSWHGLYTSQGRPSLPLSVKQIKVVDDTKFPMTTQSKPESPPFFVPLTHKFYCSTSQSCSSFAKPNHPLDLIGRSKMTSFPHKPTALLRLQPPGSSVHKKPSFALLPPPLPAKKKGRSTMEEEEK